MTKTKRQQIWEQMNKLYGNDGMCGITQVDTIPSGSHVLDDAMLIGGLPRGRLIQYAGKEGCGKTFMSLMAIKEWQSLNPDNWAIFIDAEYTYDDRWIKKLGLDQSRIFLIKENDSIAVFTQLCGVPNKEYGKSKAKLGILDMEVAEPSGLGLIIIDSIAALKSPIEMKKAVGNTNIAPMARFLPDALGRLTPLLSKTNSICIAINQSRVDPGKMWGDPLTTPGGRALKHHHSMMVNFTNSEAKSGKLYDMNEDVYGHIVNARIDKNKLAPSHRKCQFRIGYVNGVVDKHMEIGDLAVKYNIITKPNSQSYEYNDKKWRGKDNLYEGIMEHNLLDELLQKIKECWGDYQPALEQSEPDYSVEETLEETNVD